MAIYHTLGELNDAIYALAAPGGAVYNAVIRFFDDHQADVRSARSGIWPFLWLKSAPLDAEPVRQDPHDAGTILNLPTYGGMLNRAVTRLIAVECRKFALVDGQEDLHAWIELAETSPFEIMREAVDGTVDWVTGCHDLVDTALLNYLHKHGLITEQEVGSLVFYGELCDRSLIGTPYAGRRFPVDPAFLP